MRPIHSLALALTVIAAGCSGHGFAGSPLPSDVTVMGTLSALPQAKLTVHTSSNRLHKMDGWGGIGTASATVMDAPPIIGGSEAEQVNLAIVRIDAVGDQGTGTLAQFDAPYVANVLDFQDAPLAFDPVPMGIGHYDHVNVVIDPSQSNVVANGRTYPIHFENNLFIQGDLENGIATSPEANDVVMSVHASIDVVAGQANTFNVDFNAAESLALSEDGNSVDAKPVLAAAGNNQGSISGRVVNAYGQPVAHAVVVGRNGKEHTVNSTITDVGGFFYLHTVEAGTVKLRIYNKYKNAAGNTVRASGTTNRHDEVRGPKVTVTPQSVTNVGSLAD